MTPKFTERNRTATDFLTWPHITWPDAGVISSIYDIKSQVAETCIGFVSAAMLGSFGSPLTYIGCLIWTKNLAFVFGWIANYWLILFYICVDQISDKQLKIRNVIWVVWTGSLLILCLFFRFKLPHAPRVRYNQWRKFNLEYHHKIKYWNFIVAKNRLLRKLDWNASLKIKIWYVCPSRDKITGFILINP